METLLAKSVRTKKIITNFASLISDNVNYINGQNSFNGHLQKQTYNFDSFIEISAPGVEELKYLRIGISRYDGILKCNFDSCDSKYNFIVYVLDSKLELDEEIPEKNKQAWKELNYDTAIINIIDAKGLMDYQISEYKFIRLNARMNFKNFKALFDKENNCIDIYMQDYKSEVEHSKDFYLLKSGYKLQNDQWKNFASEIVTKAIEENIKINRAKSPNTRLRILKHLVMTRVCDKKMRMSKSDYDD